MKTRFPTYCEINIEIVWSSMTLSLFHYSFKFLLNFILNEKFRIFDTLYTLNVCYKYKSSLQMNYELTKIISINDVHPIYFSINMRKNSTANVILFAKKWNFCQIEIIWNRELFINKTISFQMFRIIFYRKTNKSLINSSIKNEFHRILLMSLQFSF